MVTALLVIIFIAAALSLMSYLYCWQDIKTGRPHIITLRQITSIMDRHRLNLIFGHPEPGYFYTIPPETLKTLIQQYRGFYIRECTADAVCMLGSWRYMLHYAEPKGLPLFLLLALACQGINIGYSLWLIRKWRDQLREEMQNPRE